MPKHRAEERIKVFLDSSVMIAATMSFTGGSFRIFHESREGELRLLTNKYAISESKRVIDQKFKYFAESFQRLISTSKTVIRVLTHQKNLPNDI